MADESNLKKIQDMLDKGFGQERIIKEQGKAIEQLNTKCDAACQAERAAKAELEKAAKEKPKTETKFKHHFMAPWAESCPDCVQEDGSPIVNPHIVPKDAINTDEECTKCKSPVLPGWKSCPECHEELD